MSTDQATESQIGIPDLLQKIGMMSVELDLARGQIAQLQQALEEGSAQPTAEPSK